MPRFSTSRGSLEQLSALILRPTTQHFFEINISSPRAKWPSDLPSLCQPSTINMVIHASLASAPQLSRFSHCNTITSSPPFHPSATSEPSFHSIRSPLCRTEYDPSSITKRRSLCRREGVDDCLLLKLWQLSRSTMTRYACT